MQSSLENILSHKGGAVFRISPDVTVSEAAQKMVDKNIGALVVTDGENIVGICTERDLLVKVLNSGLDPNSTHVSQVMTPDPVCVNAFLTVESAMHVMSEKRFRHLPVLEGDSLVGLISIGDLARWLVRSRKEHLDDVIRAVTNVTVREA